ncbi:S1 RNA-binding domain-containing protein [Flagellimonas allohymeniacidonis]|uniref:GntR family transcriptional regulator n=1 Tax=Flagellimonas allohymeniacidonis TaxID=2517819 RepID=A0A4Q8QFK0_9FLAO|nr:S1-like domain-containing RNA-binding protein [Allomuricauda hymeniacidonis]TAI48644.1 GntR family transcriptional regulator [Allomuricauda hymeniacidonis]
MIELGNFNTLKVLRSTSVGLFLGDDEDTEILLPNKYVPADFEINDELQVFCYLDNNERPIATTLQPLVRRNCFAYLEVKQVSPFGAFLDWGLEKHLLAPFREQRVRMEEGKKYVVYCYLDEESFRLVATSRINRHLTNVGFDLPVNTKVNLLVSRRTPLGWEVIIDDKFLGLLFESDVFRPIAVGDYLEGYIKNVREDNKIDVTLQPLGTKMLEPSAQLVLDRLHESGGYLSLHDKSSPDEIKNALHLSKKAFKKAIGILYKQRKILIKDDGIYLSQ